MADKHIAESVRRCGEERDAWREAYLALRAYYGNNNGKNSRRKRVATDRLKELKLK